MLRVSLLVATLALATPALGLGADFLGHWRGRPSYTPMGPLMNIFNFSIEHDANATNPTFLMSDTFLGYEAQNSTQQFWIQFTPDMTNSTLTYCGVLLNFFIAQGPATVWIVMNEIMRNDTYIEWFIDSSYFGPSRWALALMNGGSQLRSHFQMPNEEAEHYEAIYDRVPANQVGRRNLASTPFPPICTNWPGSLSIEQLHAKMAQSMKSGGAEGAFNMPSLCPYRFGKKRRELALKRDPTEAPVKTSYLGYENCYKINDYLNYTVRWTWNTSTQSVDVVFSATAPTDMEIAESYVALGIMPDFPLMHNMDIIMGHFSQDGTHNGCVRSMYALYDVGTPVANPNQTISNTKLWTEGSTMYVQFTRPWNTGHHDLTRGDADYMPSISFAMGRAADNCTSNPHYHFGNRGTYGFWFPNASMALSDYMKCQ